MPNNRLGSQPQPPRNPRGFQGPDDDPETPLTITRSVDGHALAPRPEARGDGKDVPSYANRHTVSWDPADPADVFDDSK